MTSWVGWNTTEGPQLPPQLDVNSSSYPQAQQPSPVPSGCSIPLPEAPEPAQPRTHQPPCPPPNLNLLENIRLATPINHKFSKTETSCRLNEVRRSREPSPTSNYRSDNITPTIPPALARDPRRRNAWLKARAQYARDKEARRIWASKKTEVSSEPEISPKILVEFGPKRKHSVFIKEQELKRLMEDRAGTPHISELHAYDDVSVQLSVQELSMGGEVTALETEGNLLRESEIPNINNIPTEGSEIR